MLYGEELFRAGIGVMCAAAAIAVVSIAVFSVSGRRLRKKLDGEYGPQRHK